MGTSTKNVIVFGESGSGKSSLVNLLLGQNEANVSDKAVGCTFEFKKYEMAEYNLYDTVGLSEGSVGTRTQAQAIKQLLQLLKSLGDGVSLLIFVIERGRIKKSLEDNYKLFIDTICMKKVPVVLAITHCEMENEPGTWWKENKEHFDKYRMTFNAVVSGTALHPNSAPKVMQSAIKEMNTSTVRDVLKAIDLNSLVTPWIFEGGWQDWFFGILQGVARIFLGILGYKSEGIVGLTIEQRLLKYFHMQGFSIADSANMANYIMSEVVNN